ncbi:unnamed protein product, partial [Laminaria digitata]
MGSEGASEGASGRRQEPPSESYYDGVRREIERRRKEMNDIDSSARISEVEGRLLSYRMTREAERRERQFRATRRNQGREGASRRRHERPSGMRSGVEALAGEEEPRRWRSGASAQALPGSDAGAGGGRVGGATEAAVAPAPAAVGAPVRRDSRPGTARRGNATRVTAFLGPHAAAGGEGG